MTKQKNLNIFKFILRSSKRRSRSPRDNGSKKSRRSSKSRSPPIKDQQTTVFTSVLSKIAPKVGIDANEIVSLIAAPVSQNKSKLNEIMQKHEKPELKALPSVNPNLIPITTTTAQILAARAAAIAAAQNINLQIMQQKNNQVSFKK